MEKTKKQIKKLNKAKLKIKFKATKKTQAVSIVAAEVTICQMKMAIEGIEAEIHKAEQATLSNMAFSGMKDVFDIMTDKRL